MRATARAALVAGFALQIWAQPNVAAWDVLRVGLSENNVDKRKQAVLAIASIGPAPEVIELLNSGLRDKDPVVRQTAAAAIADSKMRQCIPNLKAALSDTGEVAFVAAKALWEMGDQSGRDVLLEIITGELKDDAGFFEGALRDVKSKLRNRKYLLQRGALEASFALLGPFGMGINLAQDMMKDSGAPTRALALTMLAQHCDARSVQLMEWALTGDKNNLVRAAAAKSLGRCGNLGSVPKLMLLLAEQSEAVRYMAAASVVRLSIERPGRGPAVQSSTGTPAPKADTSAAPIAAPQPVPQSAAPQSVPQSAAPQSAPSSDPTKPSAPPADQPAPKTEPPPASPRSAPDPEGSKPPAPPADQPASQTAPSPEPSKPPSPPSDQATPQTAPTPEAPKPPVQRPD